MSPEQKKALIAMQKEQMEMQREYQKVAKPLVDEYKALLVAMKECKACKKSKFRILVCDEHFEKLEAINQALGKVQLSFKLRQDISKLP